jgi:hypothetical protein
MVILTALLIVALAVAAVLFFLLWRGPSVGRFRVAYPVATDCPSGSGAPVCYGADVTNTGSAPQKVLCRVVPAGPSTAVFRDGDSVYVSAAPIDAGRTITLFVEASPTEGSTLVERPSVSCEPL